MTTAQQVQGLQFSISDFLDVGLAFMLLTLKPGNQIFFYHSVLHPPALRLPCPPPSSSQLSCPPPSSPQTLLSSTLLPSDSPVLHPPPLSSPVLYPPAPRLSCPPPSSPQAPLSSTLLSSALLSSTLSHWPLPPICQVVGQIHMPELDDLHRARWDPCVSLKREMLELLCLSDLWSLVQGRRS